VIKRRNQNKEKEKKRKDKKRQEKKQNGCRKGRMEEDEDVISKGKWLENMKIEVPKASKTKIEGRKF